MANLIGKVTIAGVEHDVIIPMPNLNDVCAENSSTEYTAQFGALKILSRDINGELFQVNIEASHAKEESTVFIGNQTGDADVVSDIDTTFDTVDGKRVSVKGGRIVSVCATPEPL